MTNQEALNKVWDYFVVQGNPPSYDGSSCFYRLNGKRCAVGVLIPDEEYAPDMEDIVAPDMIQVVPSLSGLSGRFLLSIQTTHDDASSEPDFGSEIVKRLRWVAEDYGLEVPK